MPDYSIRLYQLKYYIKMFFPEIFYHLKNQQIQDIFISKWVLTIFSSYLPFETLAHVWDNFLQVLRKFNIGWLESHYQI